MAGSIQWRGLGSFGAVKQDQTEGQKTGAQPDGMRRERLPLRAILALALCLAAAAAVHWAGVPLSVTRPGQVTAPQGITLTTGHAIQVIGAFVFAVAGLVCAFSLSQWSRRAFEPVIGPDYGAILRFVLLLAGICLVVLAALSMLNFNVSQLVLGGAVTGVLLGIAAQQALANLFAGVVIQIARPFRLGDRVQIRSGALAGAIEGVVTEFSVTYVRLETNEGPMLLPNAQVLASAVAPLPPAPPAPLEPPSAIVASGPEGGEQQR